MGFNAGSGTESIGAVLEASAHCARAGLTSGDKIVICLAAATDTAFIPAMLRYLVSLSRILKLLVCCHPVPNVAAALLPVQTCPSYPLSQ